MPPPKKAAKKAAKKPAKPADPKHKQLKDVRRAFEHLGRIESLQSSLKTDTHTDVSSLVLLSQEELNARDAKNAADLLRAAEHLSFAALAAGHLKQSKLSTTVLDGIEEEYEHLTRKALEHWGHSDDRHTVVATLYKRSFQEARRAFSSSNFRQALELIRAAEALSHVVKHGPEKLMAAKSALSFTGSRK